MNFASKIIAVFTVVVVFVSIFALPVNATNVTYSCNSVCGKKGDVVTINVEMSSGVSLWGTMISLEYDSLELQYVSSSKGGLVANGSLNAVESKITFAGQLDTDLSIDGGTIFTVEFKILKDSGSSTLEVIPSNLSGDHITDDGEAVSVNSTNGKIDILDYYTLVQIATLMQIPTDEQFKVGDVYEDGTIDGFDVIYFDLLINDIPDNSDDTVTEETTTPIADVQYSVSSVSGKNGDIVTVDVKMSSGVPLWGTVISLSFDSSELQYVSSSKGELVAMGSLNANDSKITFAGMLDTSLSIDGGTIFTVSFKILKGSGSSVLTVIPSSIAGDHITDDGKSVLVGSINGKVDIA